MTYVRLQLYGLTRRLFQVPVIALFTKYEQFRRDIKIRLEDERRETDIDAEVKSAFDEHYLDSLREPPSLTPRFVCLESEDSVSHEPIFY